MDTLIQSNTETFSAKAENAQTQSKVSSALSELEANRFGFMPLLLIIMACLGGITAAFAAQGSDLKLMAVAITSTFVEILIIALAPIRLILIASLIAFIVNLLVFIF